MGYVFSATGEMQIVINSVADCWCILWNGRVWLQCPALRCLCHSLLSLVYCLFCDVKSYVHGCRLAVSVLKEYFLTSLQWCC